MARRVSLNDPDLAIEIIKEDGGVILTDFSTTALVEQVNADAAPYINAIVKEVIDPSLSTDPHPFAQPSNETPTNTANSAFRATSHARHPAARCCSDAAKPLAKFGFSNPACSKSSTISCTRFRALSTMTSRYRRMQFSQPQRHWTLGLECRCRVCIAMTSFGSRLITGTAPERESILWVGMWVWACMFLVWILLPKMGLRSYDFFFFVRSMMPFCSWSSVYSRLSSLGPRAKSPVLRGKPHLDERGRGIYSPRLDGARRWSEHYFSEQAFARVFLLPLVFATRGNPSVS